MSVSSTVPKASSLACNEASSRIMRILRYAEAPLLVAVPVVLMLAAVFQVDQAALLTMAVALVAVGVFVAGYETSRPALRQIMPTVVLSALAVAGRILFFAVPAFKPVSAICIVAGAVFGKRCGFMTGVLAALVSNFFFGQGVWTPWQMYAWGLVGYFAGVLSAHGFFDSATQQVRGKFQIRKIVLYVYAFAAAFLYGVLLDTWTLVGFIRPLTLTTALLTYGAGLSYNVVHGIATVLFLLIIYAPWRRKLERIKLRISKT